MNEHFPERSGDEQERRRERAQDFLDTHLNPELSIVEYMLGEIRKWAETDKTHPFWIRTDTGEADDIRVEYVMPYGLGEEGGSIVFGSYGRIDIDESTVRAMLANPDVAGEVRGAVPAFEAEPSLDAIADALDIVEGSFSQRLADHEALLELDWDIDE